MTTQVNHENNNLEILKILLVGDKHVGLTTFTKKICSGIYDQSTIETIGVNFSLKPPLNNNSVGYQLWQIASGIQNKFDSINPYYFVGSNGSILMFDVTNRESFQHIEYYIESILMYNQTFIPFAILGNKIDLRKKKLDSVTDKEAAEYCVKLLERFGRFNCKIKYFPISTLEDENFDECFTYLSESFIEFRDSLPKILLGGDKDSADRAFFRKYIIQNEFNIQDTIIKTIPYQESEIGIEFTSINPSRKYFIEQRIPFYKNAQGAIFIFNVTSRESFKNVDKYVKEFLQYNELETVVLVILGNDISKRIDDPNSIADQEAETYCLQVQNETKRTGLKIQYIPISIETNLNVEKCFTFLAKTCANITRKE